MGREGPSTFERAGDLEEVVIVQLELLVDVLTRRRVSIREEEKRIMYPGMLRSI